MQKYYRELGLPENASIKEIKKAYRVLALKYHPDRNKDVDASEKFRTISDAYQILIDYKERGHIPPPPATRQQGTSSATSDFARHQEFLRKERERQDREFSEFMKTDRYKFYQYGEMLVQILSLSPVIILFAILWFQLAKAGIGGFIIGFFICLPVLFVLWAMRKAGSFSDYGAAICFFATNKRTLFLAPVMFSIVVFFKIGMNTFLPTYALFGSYLLSVVFLIYRLRTKRATMKQTFIAVIPLTFISLLLLINFVFAAQPKSHYYKWKHGKTTVFILENHKFEKEWHIRWLFKKDDSEPQSLKLEELNRITHREQFNLFQKYEDVAELKIAKGLLGIPVLKGYTFYFGY